MNELTILSPKTLAEAKDLATTLAASKTIPDALQKSPADVLAIVMAGAELGFAPMQAIRALRLIKGQPTLSADAMGALVRSRPDVCEYLILRHSDRTRATYETRRRGDDAPTSMSFSSEEAREAKLIGDNWQRFPAAMLRARALSAICRAVYPDLLLGVYDPDELAQELDVTPGPRAVPASGITPKTEAETVAALSASIAAVASGRSSDRSPAKAPLMRVPVPDFGPDGAPVSERARLEVAISEAQDESGLVALVDRISSLASADKAALRDLWGARRTALRAAQAEPPHTDADAPEPGSEG